MCVKDEIVMKRNERKGKEEGEKKAFDIMSDDCKNPSEWWFVLHFPVDEICTTADCTQSGKHCVFVCAFSLLSHSKGFDFSQRRAEWENWDCCRSQGISDILRENGLFNCDYIASKSKTVIKQTETALISRNMLHRVIVLWSRLNNSKRSWVASNGYKQVSTA